MEAVTKIYCCVVLWRQGFLVIILSLVYYPVSKAVCTPGMCSQKQTLYK